MQCLRQACAAQIQDAERNLQDSEGLLQQLQSEMLAAAEGLEFEKAAALRDRMAKLRGEKVASPQVKKGKRGGGKKGFRG